MSLSLGDNFFGDNQGLDIPFSISVYLLDSCKQGTVFDRSTYQPKALTDWLSNWLETVSAGIPIPRRFHGTKLSEIFMERINFCLKESNLEKTLLSIKESDVKSIKQLIEENKKSGQKEANALEERLRSDEFPPYLWMEYNRINKTFLDVSKLLIELIDRMYKFAPKYSSAVHEKNRLVRTKVSSYSELIDGYFNAMAAYFRLSMFMEAWSCKEESEFFTKKCVWTFKNVDAGEFEIIFMAFHESVSNLRQAFLKINANKNEMDFSKPTDWAFKQLILMM